MDNPNKKFILCILFLIVGIQLFISTDGQQQVIRRKRPLGPGQRKTLTYTTPPPSLEEESGVGGGGISDSCPEPNGFFPDAYQCDKYYECTDGKVKEKLCPDGLVFIDAGPKIEKCEFNFAVDCTDRPELQEPHPSLNCPRKNGYFAHNDTSICDKFFFCVDGNYNAITCPAGLVFANKTGTCTWPDQARKAHCSSGELFDFDCPKLEGEHQPGTMIHPRYPDPKDCQFFYVCIDGKVPRKNGCPLGTVYSEKTGQCSKPKDVPECKDWYKGILDYDEEGEIATTRKPTPTPGAAGTKRKIKRPPTRVVAYDDE